MAARVGSIAGGRAGERRGAGMAARGGAQLRGTRRRRAMRPPPPDRLSVPRRQGHENPAVGPQRQPLLGDGGTQEVSTEPLEPVPILARDGNGAMQVEAVTTRL